MKYQVQRHNAERRTIVDTDDFHKARKVYERVSIALRQGGGAPDLWRHDHQHHGRTNIAKQMVIL